MLVLIAAIFQKVLTGTNSVAHLPQKPVAVLANLILATGPITKIITINYVYWSLTCEVCFYLVIGIMLLLKANWSIFFLIIISLTSMLLPQQNTGLLFFFDSWPAFGCGISLYCFFNRAQKSGRNLWWLLAVINLYGLINKFLAINEMGYIAVTLITVAIIWGSNYIKLPTSRQPAEWQKQSTCSKCKPAYILLKYLPTIKNLRLSEF